MPGKVRTARTVAREKKRYDYNRAVIAMFKQRPCDDCGVQYPPYVMQFDHRDPATKKFDIGSAVSGKAVETLLAEIMKCDLVCANCHAERTHLAR